jgi:hypothetical protein
MKKLRLAKLPDRVPVKMTFTLPPELAARLRLYADIYAEAYGAREEPADLVPYMVDAFLKSDSTFRRANRTLTESRDTLTCASPQANVRTRAEPTPTINDAAKKPRMPGPRSEIPKA